MKKDSIKSSMDETKENRTNTPLEEYFLGIVGDVFSEDAMKDAIVKKINKDLKESEERISDKVYRIMTKAMSLPFNLSLGQARHEFMKKATARYDEVLRASLSESFQSSPSFVSKTIDIDELVTDWIYSNYSIEYNAKKYLEIGDSCCEDEGDEILFEYLHESENKYWLDREDDYTSITLEDENEDEVIIILTMASESSDSKSVLWECCNIIHKDKEFNMTLHESSSKGGIFPILYALKNKNTKIKEL
ncbi:hypothetical protein JHD46_05355 [Sulfurimonas sp. SAG-AH-194-C20]|nr:hypothetical protein [Sulfurimonas sp. SAG-AH-194-C20]MDF1879066.1 hypothetical protein [Sulfurimonas sp. SAG-AH-194-C20]